MADPECQVEIEFGGLGRLFLNNSLTVIGSQGELGPALRSRILSFMVQLQVAMPKALPIDDAVLVKMLVSTSPEAPLIPHYRSLVKEVLACGLEF